MEGVRTDLGSPLHNQVVGEPVLKLWEDCFPNFIDAILVVAGRQVVDYEVDLPNSTSIHQHIGM